MKTSNKRRHLRQSLTTSLSSTFSLSFSTVRLQVFLGLPRLLFPSGAQVTAVLIFELFLLFVHIVDGLISCLASVFSKFSEDISGGIYQASPHLFGGFPEMLNILSLIIVLYWADFHKLLRDEKTLLASYNFFLISASVPPVLSIVGRR